MVPEAMKPENQLGLTTALSSANTRDLGPALQKVISDNLAVGIAEARIASEGQPWSGELVAALESQFAAADRGGPARRTSSVGP